MRESTHVNASSRFPRSASADHTTRGLRLPAMKAALGASVLGVALFNVVPAASAAEVTNPADNPAPITITIDGQQYRDGLDTLPGYDDYACTPIPNVEYDFSTNSIVYYDNDNQPIKTAKWTEWDRISSYATWKKQQQAAASTPAPSSSASNTSSSTSSSASSGSASAPSASAAPDTSSSSGASSAPAASASSPAASSSPSTPSASSANTAAASSSSSSPKGSKSSSSSKRGDDASSGSSSNGGGAGAPATVAGAGTVKAAGAATATEPGKDGDRDAAGLTASGNGDGGGAAGGAAGDSGVPGAINAAGNALVSGPPAPVGVTPAAQSVGKVVASGAGNTRVAGLLILAALTITGLVLFFGNFARRAAFGTRGTGQAA